MRTPRSSRSLLLVLMAVGCSDPSGVASSFAIGEDSVVLLVGEHTTLEFSAGDGMPLWSVHDPSTVEVANGVLLGRAPGVTWVYGRSGNRRDSVRVTVRSANLPSGVVRARVQDDEGVQVELEAWSVWRRKLSDQVCCTQEQIVGATSLIGNDDNGALHASFLGRPDFADLVQPSNTRSISGYTLSGSPEEFYFAGDEGIVVYMPSDRGPSFRRMYVPVDGFELTTFSDGDEAFPEGDDLGGGVLTDGRFRGTASFDAAGFLVELPELGRQRIVSQLADTTVSVFVEFDATLHKWLIGDGSLDLQGSRYAWSEDVFGLTIPFAQPVGDGVVLTVGRIQVGQNIDQPFESDLEIWLPSPAVGARVLEAGSYDTSSPAARGRLVLSAPDKDGLEDPDAVTATLIEGTAEIERYMPASMTAMGLLFGSIHATLEFENGPYAGDKVEVSTSFKAPILPIGYEGLPWAPGGAA